MIESINNNLDTISYIVAAFILFSPYLLKKWFGKSHIASLTITIGIFGTFLGVFIGLLNFNIETITESVPLLIGGLKTAFVTSLAGLLANIILRIIPSIYGFENETAGVKSDDLGGQIIASLNKLSNSIAGEGESTIVTQLQKIRTTNVDGFDKMEKSFKTFAEKVVADNTRSLINALAQVMQDFNSKINEQFGDNFKKLNEAVSTMIIWQDKYKTHVETLTEKFTSISDNLKGVDTSLKNTALSHEKINQMNEVLNNLIKDFSTEVNSFAEIGSKAKDAFPIIELNMNNLIKASNKYVTKTIENLNNQYNSFADKQSNIVSRYGERLNEFEELTTNNFNKYSLNQEKLIEQSADYVKNNIDSLKSQYNEFAEIQKNILSIYTNKLEEFSSINEANFKKYSLRQEELASSYTSTIHKMIDDNAERIRKLDTELGQELNKALEGLGSHLTSLSQHFVDDYRPLTESLKRVVEMSRNIEE